MPECRTCRYADPTVLSNVDDIGPAAVLLCRRYPPVPVYEVDTEGTAPSWPLVHEQEWCGEWKGDTFMAEHDRIVAENKRFRDALERIANEPAPGYTLSCRNIARAALSDRSET